MSHVIETLPHHAALTSSHHMQNASIALSKEAVAEIKRVAAFTEQTRNKLDALQAKVDALANLAGEVKASNAAAAAAAEQNAEMHMLQQAIVMAKSGVGAFDFKQMSSNGYSQSEAIVNSSAIVFGILKTFMRGLGKWISNEYYCRNSTDHYIGYHHQVTEEEKAAFRDALSIQIHELTGTKPRIVKEKNGAVEQWVIYRK